MITNNYGQKYYLLFVTCAFLVIGISLTACAKPEPAPSLTPIPAPPLIEEWSADGIIKVREYYGAENYDDFEILWRNDEQNIYIGMKAKTSGWVSMAFQPGSRMKDADMVLGFVRNGETTIFDLFSTGDFGPHFPDDQFGGANNVLEFGGSEDGEFTIVEFRRALNTGDEYDVAVSSGENKIIWAYSSSDDITKKHIKRGYGVIILNQ
jgi:hypothetical protein